MHDRRLDGKVLTFGNRGVLFMNAMTWWDHGTRSVWSQPWGAAIAGPLRGRSLTLLPAEVAPWSTWKSEHPDTRVLVDERGLVFGHENPTNGFVIGVAIQDAAVGYYYGSAAEAGVLNDDVGSFPIVVIVNRDARAIDVYLRRGGSVAYSGEAALPDALTFRPGGEGQIIDAQTGSTWDARQGAAIDGPLRGAALQRVPYVTARDWAWVDFFPHTEFRGAGDRPLPYRDE